MKIYVLSFAHLWELMDCENMINDVMKSINVDNSSQEVKKEKPDIISDYEEHHVHSISIDDENIYSNSFEHLLDELNWIDKVVRRHITKYNSVNQGEIDDFLGLFTSEEEVNAILQTRPFGPDEDACMHQELDEIEIIHREIKKKKVESINNGKKLRLSILEEIFHLSPFDVDVLLICLAVELDLRYEKLYSYLQNDVTRKRPSIDLMINLFCSSWDDRMKARQHFTGTAPLIKNRIVHLDDQDHGDLFPLLTRSVKVDERVINYLLEFDEIDPRIRNYSTLIEPKKSFDDLIVSEELKSALNGLVTWHSHDDAVIFEFHGPYGTGKKLTAEVICHEFGKTLLIVDSKALVEENSFEMLTIILRECLLQDSILFLEGFDILLEDESSRFTVINLLEKLDKFQKWIFLSGEQFRQLPDVIKKHNIYSFAFPLPSFTNRKKLWESLLNEIHNVSNDVETNALSSKFKLSGGQIRDAIFTACNIAMARNPENFELTTTDLYQGCKVQSSTNLSTFANKIEPYYTWKDIVLPKDTKEQLKEICGYIKHKGTVYSDWGFDTKLSLGKGLNVLFSGSSGTGKTMAAEVIAKVVGLDIYKIDLSGVVSKYIGETEKHLNKIFLEAETSNAILFFDEADALFGKRSEIRDSHDRYANIEVNYLLQKMEEHEGIVILASNYIQNIDEAFQRRMHFKIDFPLPDKELREKIWRKIFPKETPINIPQVYLSDIKNVAHLVGKLCDDRNPLSKHFQENVIVDLRKFIDILNYKDDIHIRNFTMVLVDDLNKLINTGRLYDEQRFANVPLKPETKKLSKGNPEGKDRIRLNRLLLEEVYPNEIAQSYIDFDFLSQLKIAGGNIKNIALSSAFLAVGESSAIRMEHIIRATKREFQKMEKLCMAEDFGDYYNMLEVRKK